MLKHGLEASSLQPDGRRPFWKLIWQCPVPPKVRHLSWRIAKDALATQQNKRIRGIETPDTCLICGQEVEDTYHVFMRCPHARNLWSAMKEVWDLPGDKMLNQGGTEWLLQLLSKITEEQRARTPNIEGSRRFLMSYMDSLQLIKQYSTGDIEKGKMVLTQSGTERPECLRTCTNKPKQLWKPPDVGTLKLNVDGSFDDNANAGVGIVLHDHQGEVIITSCGHIHHCSDATETELAAMELGLAQALSSFFF
uniref:Uncharacterized protein n=1 Tax=Avena sativa TaxID=4498 RepID=A0ACD5YVZ4_AVESA